MSVPDSFASLPDSVKTALNEVRWRYDQSEDERRTKYIIAIHDKVLGGQSLSLEESSALVVNTLTLQRENAELRKKVDDVIVELIKVKVDRFPFRC